MGENNSDLIDHYDIILFDGVCNLCNYAVIFIIDRDHQKKYRFTSLQSPLGKELLKRFHLPVLTMNSLVLIRQKKVFVKSTAALKIARHLNGLWPLAYIFILVPSFIRNVVYDFIAKYRYKIFGKSESCYYPSDELKVRFLDH